MKSFKIFFMVPALAFAMLATLTFSSCSNATQDISPPVNVADEGTASVYTPGNDGSISLRTDCNGDEIHWLYEGPEGPDHWAELCPEWSCGGMAQSPVNIVPPPARKKSKSLYFYWEDSETHIVNNGHTIQFNYDQPGDLATNHNQGSYITLNGQKYHLLQFHLHAASEHTVNGGHFPAEIHFVHKNLSTGKLAVIGVFIEEGAENPFFADFLEHFPHSEGDYESADSYNANELMPQNYNHWLKQHFWWYEGSLTTPPCSEIVSWMVWSSTIQASHEQLVEMEEILHENYRPVEPLNSRLVRAQ